MWGAKTHTFSTAFPSVWRAAACFLTVCKIELDTVGNLTSRQTCIFFSPQVLVFLVFPSLSPPGFLSCNCHQTLCPRTLLSTSISTISPQLCLPLSPGCLQHQEPPPLPPQPLTLSSSGQLTHCHQRWSETGHVHRVHPGASVLPVKSKYVAYICKTVSVKWQIQSKLHTPCFQIETVWAKNKLGLDWRS